MSQAAHAMGLSRSTPSKWDNLAELEEAVEILKLDMIEATKLALEGLSLKAVKSIMRVLENRDDNSAVAAAKAVWDRIGLPGLSSVDVTSGGERLTPISFVEIAPPEDDT